MSPLLSVESALQRVLGTLVACDRPVIEVELLKALGCVLARDVISSIAVPGDDNSAMDGLLEGAIPMVQLLWKRETEGKKFDSPERKAGLDFLTKRPGRG